MAKLVKKTNALLAILFVLVGIGLLSNRQLMAAGTNEWLAASASSATSVTAAMNPFDGRGLIDGIILSSQPAAAAYVEVRDSATANGSYTSTFGPIATVFFSSNTTTAGASAAQGLVVSFKPPLRIYNGLSINASNCNTNTMCYSVQYRQVSD